MRGNLLNQYRVHKVSRDTRSSLDWWDEKNPKILADTFPYDTWPEAKDRLECHPGNTYFPHPGSSVPDVIEHLKKSASKLKSRAQGSNDPDTIFV